MGKTWEWGHKGRSRVVFSGCTTASNHRPRQPHSPAPGVTGPKNPGIGGKQFSRLKSPAEEISLEELYLYLYLLLDEFSRKAIQWRISWVQTAQEARRLLEGGLVQENILDLRRTSDPKSSTTAVGR